MNQIIIPFIVFVQNMTDQPISLHLNNPADSHKHRRNMRISQIIKYNSDESALLFYKGYRCIIRAVIIFLCRFQHKLFCPFRNTAGFSRHGQRYSRCRYSALFRNIFDRYFHIPRAVSLFYKRQCLSCNCQLFVGRNYKYSYL